MSPDYEIEEESHPIAQHFMGQTTEEDLRAIHELKTEIAALEAILEAKIATVKEQNKGEENVQRGNYIACLKPIAGRVSCDWQRAYHDAVGEMPKEDVSKYVVRGKETVRLEVKRLG